MIHKAINGFYYGITVESIADATGWEVENIQDAIANDPAFNIYFLGKQWVNSKLQTLYRTSILYEFISEERGFKWIDGNEDKLNIYDINYHIIERLKQLLPYFGTTKARSIRVFASGIHTSEEFVRAIDKGDTPLPLPLLHFLSLYGVNLNWLLTGSGDMFHNKKMESSLHFHNKSKRYKAKKNPR